MSSHFQVITTNISTVSYYTYLHVLLPWLLSGRKVTNLLWYRTFSQGLKGLLEFIPAVRVHATDKPPVHWRATFPLPPTEKLERGLWDEAEGPERTHTGTDRTCELHKKKDPGPGIKPVTFSLGVDRHCKPLRHCITLSKDVFSSSKGTCVTHVGCFIMVKRRVYDFKVDWGVCWIIILSPVGGGKAS